MIKNVTQFKSVIQGIENVFHFDQQCPIEVAKQAIFDCLKWLGQIEDNVKAKAAEDAAKPVQDDSVNVEPTKAE